MEVSVVLSPDGNIIQTEKELDLALLPQPVKDYVATQLGGKQITSANLIDSNGQISYEAEVDKKDFLFDGNGQFTGQEDEENGDEEDKD